MHPASLKAMKKFIDDYLQNKTDLIILDVGSYDVNGNYRYLFQQKGWTYVGGDIKPGPNVDIVFNNMYNWDIESKFFDVVISGQAIEHIQDMKQWIIEVSRIIKVGGILCIITPWQFPIHRFPIDCWRILPDGMTWLLRDAGKLDILNIYMAEDDIIGIARKPEIQ